MTGGGVTRSMTGIRHTLTSLRPHVLEKFGQPVYVPLNRSMNDFMMTSQATKTPTVVLPPPTQAHVDTALESGLVCCSSVSGGIGLSTLSAMVARQVASRGPSCALVDADFRAGGLDVLLGLENEPGLRFGDIEAPIGRIEGEALERGLPHWDGVSVLAHHPWDGDEPQVWEVQAALSALNRVHDIVLVDCADGTVWRMLPELRQAVHLVAVELSVLGLARAGAHLSELNVEDETDDHTSREVMVVGFPPYRSGHRGTVVVSREEAEDYLGLPLIATVRYDQGLAHDLVEGFGITSIPRGSRVAVEAIVERLR